jgi:hypothetical protein
MRYFEQLPILVYGDSVNARNIFDYLKLVSIDDSFIEYYSVKDGERIENISYDLYDTVDHWWILCIINGFKDFFHDLPYSENTMRAISAEETGSAAIIAKYDELMILNNQKRSIKIIKPILINQVMLTIARSI